MGRTAESKLEEADRLDTRASKIVKRDPVSSQALKDLARTKRTSAIRQMKRKPGRKGSG